MEVSLSPLPLSPPLPFLFPLAFFRAPFRAAALATPAASGVFTRVRWGVWTRRPPSGNRNRRDVMLRGPGARSWRAVVEPVRI